MGKIPIRALVYKTTQINSLSVNADKTVLSSSHGVSLSHPGTGSAIPWLLDNHPDTSSLLGRKERLTLNPEQEPPRRRGRGTWAVPRKTECIKCMQTLVFCDISRKVPSFYPAPSWVDYTEQGKNHWLCTPLIRDEVSSQSASLGQD